MLKLLKNMRRKEVLMVLLCTVFVAVQVYFDLRLPDYMTDLTTLIKTSGATADILSVGVKMLGCTLASAVLAVGCGCMMYLAVSGYKKTGSLLMLIAPVAVFILSKFDHCVADAFYLACAGGGVPLWYLPVVVAGNTVGSIALYRITTAGNES